MNMSEVVATTTLSLAPITCETCKISKDATEFATGADGSKYPGCTACFLAEKAKFWADKTFRFCITCNTYVPLRKFTWKDGIPFQRCTKCFEAIIIERKMRDREAARERSPSRDRKNETQWKTEGNRECSNMAHGDAKQV